jgi:hypothetical protein
MSVDKDDKPADRAVLSIAGLRHVLRAAIIKLHRFLVGVLVGNSNPNILMVEAA